MLSVAGVSTAAEVHRWYDSEGRVHFSDTKPLDVDTVVLTIDAPTDSSSSTAQSPFASIERAAPNVQDEQTPGAQEMQISELIGPCTQARQQFAVLHEEMPIYRTAEGLLRPDWFGDTYRGKRDYLADEDLDAAIGPARNRVLEHCSDPDDVEAEILAYNEWIEAEFCSVATVRLAAMERPCSRTSASEISRQRAVVEEQCK